MAALTIDHAIADALANPQRVGVTWGAEIAGPPIDDAAVARVQRAAPGASVAVARRDVIDVAGVGVPAYAIRNAAVPAGAVALVTVTGRAPAQPDEADIGPATARELHTQVGQWIRVAGSHEIRLVGIALFPTDVHAEFDEGLWLTPAGLDSIVPAARAAPEDRGIVVRFPDRGRQEQTALQVAVTAQAIENLPPGPSPDTRLIAALGGPASSLGSNVMPPSIPLELTNLQNVQLVPTILGISLGVLALAALSYILVVAGRARRRDFAVLRAIGLGSGAARRVVFAQATVIAAVGLVVGIPLGVVVSRVVWRAVSTRVPLVYVPPASMAVIAEVVPAFLVAAILVALWPARRTARERPAVLLRTE